MPKVDAGGVYRVTEQTWPSGDKYLAVQIGEVQIPADDGWQAGDRVRVTITIEAIRGSGRAPVAS